LPFFAFVFLVLNDKMSMLMQGVSRLARQFTRPLIATRHFAAATPYGAGDEVLVERLDGARQGISVIGLNRPAAKNSFSRGMVETFTDVLDDIKKDNGSRVVVIRSLSPGIFCAGADLKERKGEKFCRSYFNPYNNRHIYQRNESRGSHRICKGAQGLTHCD